MNAQTVTREVLSAVETLATFTAMAELYNDKATSDKMHSEWQRLAETFTGSDRIRINTRYRNTVRETRETLMNAPAPFLPCTPVWKDINHPAGVYSVLICECIDAN